MDVPKKKSKGEKTPRKGQLNTERELAKFYFFNGETQKSIAEKLGVSAQTVKRWAKDDNWESLRAAKTITRTEIVNNMLQNLNRRIVEGSLNADEAAKMAKAIKSLDGETNIITVIEVFTAYNKWLIARMQFDVELTPELVRTQLHGFGFQHHSQPKVISITQPTELGTLYTLDEVKAIAELAHSHGMYLHMDGARLANAAVALDKSFREITADAGVDALSFGGTKNGLMMGEAVVLLDTSLNKNFLYRRKQAMQLCSKTRFLAVQFQAYFRHELWRKNAEHANRTAQLLYRSVKGLPQVKIVYPVQANAVFAQLPREVWKKLQEHYFFYEWDEAADIVRWMCAFDTTEADIEAFAETLNGIINTTDN